MHSAAKVLKFPLSGIARDIDYRKAYIPEEEVQFATPFALNVRGSDTFHRRNRGGSRPGLSVTTVPTGADTHNPHKQYATTGLLETPVAATAFYRARTVAAVGTMWYMSAMGDSTNWTFNGDSGDPSRAFAGNVENATIKGDAITAMMPVRDQWLFIATAHSLWCMTGDPIGGTLKCVSEHIGCVSRDAWCFDGEALWVLSNQGLYRIGIGEMPLRMSHHIPEEFRGTSAALLAYDPEDNAIHIFSIRGSGVSEVVSDWFYDIENKAFWRQSFKEAHRPTEICTYMKDGVNVLAFKGGDNAWRVFDDEADTDSGETFVSRVAIGPVRCSARDDMDGMVAEIEATLAAGSEASLVSVYTAHSPEEAVRIAYNDQIPVSTFAVKSGWNNVCRPRQRGAWAVFVLSSTGRWGFESMTTIAKQLGRLRR